MAHGSVLSFKKNNARAERLMNHSKMNAPSRSTKKNGTAYGNSKADLIAEMKRRQLANSALKKEMAEKAAKRQAEAVEKQD
jgi:hypothetical protein